MPKSHRKAFLIDSKFQLDMIVVLDGVVSDLI